MKKRNRLLAVKFHLKIKMRNFNSQFKKAVGSGKAKDLVKAGKILSNINQLITKNFSIQTSAQPKISKIKHL